MTPRQREELQSIPMWQMAEVRQKLRDAGREYAQVLLDEYEERLAIICEGREATPADVSAAWGVVL